jgi:hypothetical protein
MMRYDSENSVGSALLFEQVPVDIGTVAGTHGRGWCAESYLC